MKHLVQFSTGAGSAEVAYRVHAANDPADVVLITADTRKEDWDNWRFSFEVVPQLPGVQWIVLCDGRTPMEVGRDARVVPNNRMAVCSRVLKRELIRRHLDATYDPADSIVYEGFDWTEDNRILDAYRLVTCKDCKADRERGHCDDHALTFCDERPARPGAKPYCGRVLTEAHVHPWAPWDVQFPLTEAPLLEKAAVLDLFRSRGIEPPRLYALGAKHANCGGACVRGGQAAWAHLLWWNRPRFLEWEAEEEETRTMLGKDVSVLKDRRGGGQGVPLPLRRFRERLEVQPSLFDASDWGACGCFMDDPDEPLGLKA